MLHNVSIYTIHGSVMGYGLFTSALIPLSVATPRLCDFSIAPSLAKAYFSDPHSDDVGVATWRCHKWEIGWDVTGEWGGYIIIL